MNKKNIIKNLKLVIITLLLLVGINYVSAGFSSPSSWSSLNGNVSPLINTGSGIQVKDGSLSVNAFKVSMKSLFENDTYIKGMIRGDTATSPLVNSTVNLGFSDGSNYANNVNVSLKLEKNLSIINKLVLNDSGGGSKSVVPLCADSLGRLTQGSSSGCGPTTPSSGNVCESSPDKHCHITFQFNRSGSPIVTPDPWNANSNSWDYYQAGIQLSIAGKTIYLNQGGQSPIITQDIDLGTTWMSNDPDKLLKVYFYGCSTGSANCASGANISGWSCQVSQHIMNFYGPVDILKVNDKSVSQTFGTGASCSDFNTSSLVNMDINVPPNGSRSIYFNW
jgi:hypothetical protein